MTLELHRKFEFGFSACKVVVLTRSGENAAMLDARLRSVDAESFEIYKNLTVFTCLDL